MYVYFNNVAISRKHYCNGNATMFCSSFLSYMSPSTIKNTECYTKMVYGNFISPATLECNWVFIYGFRYFCPIFNRIWTFMRDFHESTKLSNLTEICPFGAAMLRADKYTNMTNLIGTYRDYTN
jgi:hypothetical protein